MIQAARLINGQFNHLLGTWSQANLAKDDAVSTTNDKFNGTANFVQFNAKIRENFGGYTLALTNKAEKEVLCADVILLEALGFFLSETQNFSGPLGEFIKPVSIVHLFITPLSSLAEGGTEPSVSLR